MAQATNSELDELNNTNQDLDIISKHGSEEVELNLYQYQYSIQIIKSTVQGYMHVTLKAHATLPWQQNLNNKMGSTLGRSDFPKFP